MIQTVELSTIYNIIGRHKHTWENIVVHRTEGILY